MYFTFGYRVSGLFFLTQSKRGTALNMQSFLLFQELNLIS